MKKTIGILGGMGPAATAYFFSLIIKHTAAAKDQDHAPILIWNDSRIPPRKDAILHGGPSPLPRLLQGVALLERGGAGLIVMPCITAHYYAPQIAAAANVPFINLIEESRRHVRAHFPSVKKAGLIASSAAVKSGLFSKSFGKYGIDILTPEPRDQEKVTEAIFGARGIKAGFSKGRPKAAIVRVARALIDRGAEAVIAGCTEVPLVLTPDDLEVPLVEPMTIGARVCIKKSGHPVRG